MSSFNDHDSNSMMTMILMESTTEGVADYKRTANSSGRNLSGSGRTVVPYDMNSRCSFRSIEQKLLKCQQTQQNDNYTEQMEFESSLMSQNRNLISEKQNSRKWIDYLMVVLGKSSIVINDLIQTSCSLPSGCNILAGKKSEAMMKLTKRCCSQSINNNSLLVSVMLPFLLIFLLPSFKLELDKNNNNSNSIIIPGKTITMVTTRDSSPTDTWLRPTKTNIEHTTLPIMSELLLSLLKFPFDRLRLRSSVGFINVVEAKEMNMNHNNIIYRPNDLQEEETHMLIMAPAEHRSSYLAPTQQIPAGYQQNSRSNQRLNEHPNYQGGPIETGPQTAPQQMASLPQLQAPQLQNQADLHNGGPDYSNGPSGGESGGSGEGPQGVGSVEGGPESSSGNQSGSFASSSASSGLQTRGDLPVVRALNVKCEKNHMTVSSIRNINSTLWVFVT